MDKPVSALDFLARVSSHPAAAVNVVFGEEAYLKRQVVEALSGGVASGPDAEFAIVRYEGDDVVWRDVSDSLATVAMFGGGQPVVIVDEADGLVSRERGRLEDYVAGGGGHGVLILVVTSWPKNTRLFKAIAAGGLQVDCKTPATKAIVQWLQAESERGYQVHLTAGAAEQLFEIVGPNLGLLAGELEKLALLGEEKITVPRVREMAGGWRARTAWEMLDAAQAGEAATALRQLQRLLEAGEHPVAILAQISASLRRLAAATRVYLDAAAAGRGVTLRGSLEQAGVPPFFVGKAEQQLKRLGRQRAACLYDWLLDADLQLKGESSSPARARLVLEKLLVRLAADPAAGPRPSLAKVS